VFIRERTLPLKLKKNINMVQIPYKPNSAEVRWSLYILQTQLSSAICLESGRINVNGANAVPFLLKSGLPMTMLKSIWDLVDPEGYGSLHNM